MTDRKSLLREFDSRGVERAVAYHAHAVTHSTRVGWELLKVFIGDEPRLIPQACALPTDDNLSFLHELDENRTLTSVRLACETGKKLPFLAAIYGSLLRFLESRGTPVWIDLWQVEPRDLLDTMQKFPRIQLVLTGAHYIHYLLIKPLMRAIPQLHLELSRYEAFGQVEELTSEFGADRLIYGSGFPSYAMGPLLFYLHHCPKLTATQLQMICGGNVERLLRLEKGER